MTVLLDKFGMEWKLAPGIKEGYSAHWRHQVYKVFTIVRGKFVEDLGYSVNDYPWKYRGGVNSNQLL